MHAFPPTGAPGRERPATPPAHSVARPRRLGRAAGLALALVAAACGGEHGDRYARATDVQRQCCEHLSGAPRDQCLQSIVQVQDAEVAKSSTNQASYACVVDHFTCDAKTGHATQQSAQAQMECIQALE